jgi:hypothetical protein
VRPVVLDAFTPVAKPSDHILAVLTDQSDVRQMVQQSVFTIHGKDTPLNKLSGSEEFVARILIPKALKKDFRDLVITQGMNRAELFPDLDNLATYLRELSFTKDT